MASNGHVNILLIEDSPTIAKLAEMWLSEGLATPFVLHTADRLSDGLRILAKNGIDLIVLDLNLPDSAGLDTFRTVFAHAGDTPIVIMSGESDVDMATEAVREGAQDYVIKGSLNDNRLALPVRFALERVHRKQHETALRCAKEVQQRLLPKKPPLTSGFDIHGHCVPSAEVGGDYFDYFAMPDDSYGIVVGDVCGHGLASALLMVETRAVLRSLARANDDVGHILTKVNELIFDDLGDRFVSLFFGRVDPARRTLRYASAGHPSCLLRAREDEMEILPPLVPPLGVVERCRYEASGECQLAADDLLVLYTDGVTDTRDADHRLFGTAGLADVVHANRGLPAQEIVEAVFRGVRAHMNGEAPADDVTLVIVKVL
jgi:serine phosphatase RsbU (regulator of sigma subunit)